MAFSKKDQQHWISVAEGMVTEFLAAREQAALATRSASVPKAQPKHVPAQARQDSRT